MRVTPSSQVKLGKGAHKLSYPGFSLQMNVSHFKDICYFNKKGGKCNISHGAGQKKQTQEKQYYGLLEQLCVLIE